MKDEEESDDSQSGQKRGFYGTLPKRHAGPSSYDEPPVSPRDIVGGNGTQDLYDLNLDRRQAGARNNDDRPEQGAGKGLGKNSQEQEAFLKERKGSGRGDRQQQAPPQQGNGRAAGSRDDRWQWQQNWNPPAPQWGNEWWQNEHWNQRRHDAWQGYRPANQWQPRDDAPWTEGRGRRRGWNDRPSGRGGRRERDNQGPPPLIDPDHRDLIPGREPWNYATGSSQLTDNHEGSITPLPPSNVPPGYQFNLVPPYMLLAEYAGGNRMPSRITGLLTAFANGTESIERWNAESPQSWAHFKAEISPVTGEPRLRPLRPERNRQTQGPRVADPQVERVRQSQEAAAERVAVDEADYHARLREW